MSDVSIVVDTFVADGATADGDGIVWSYKQLDGWWDSASVAVSRADAQPFGEIVTHVRENGRPLALQLVAHAPVLSDPLGPLLCFTATESIDTAFKCVYQEKVLEVIDPVLDLHASVRRVGPIRHTILGNCVAVRFLIPLLAPDPYRYNALDQPFD